MTITCPNFLCCEMLENSFATLGVEESIYMLFKFLRKYIPFERALCYNIDRRKQIMTLFIDYTDNSYIKEPQSMKLIKVLQWDEIVHLFTDKKNRVTLFNNVKCNKLLQEYIVNLPQDTKSLLTIMLHTEHIKESQRERQHTLFFLSQNPEAFTQAHASLLADVRGILEKLTHSFFVSEPDPQLVLTTDGPLPASSEALLRRCPGLTSVMREVDVVAPMSTTVLIKGPTGVGKELIADTLHALSSRCAGPLVKVNCGAIPDSLLDSEFFGSEKGAFTGAFATKQGYFEQAQGGTIYLDEIGELSQPAQVRLLRVMEGQELRRVGGVRRIPLDVRIIAATHRDLWDMENRGLFRQDLCYRLHVFPIEIPTLAERPGDIPVLVDYFYKLYIRKAGLEHPPTLSHKTIRQLVSRPWPGNVRQLRYAVERALLLSMAAKSSEITFDDKHSVTRATPSAPAPTSADDICMALEKSQGRIQGEGGAAELLNVHPATLRNRMKSLGIPLPRQGKA